MVFFFNKFVEQVENPTTIVILKFNRFFQNITLYLIELWFAIYNGWSGQILFDRWAISCYNVLFTFWPPIVIGWFERPCEDKRMLAKPQLYSTSQNSQKFNGVVFWKMFANSILHSFLIFFLTYACYSDLDWSHGGFSGPSGGIAMEILTPSGQAGGYLFIGMSTIITVGGHSSPTVGV